MKVVPWCVSLLLATGLVSALPAQAAGRPAATNGRITFVTDPGTGSEIDTMRSDGSDLKTLVRIEDKTLESPHWAPDGRHLVFAVFDDIGCSVWIARADGTHMRNLTSNPTGCESAPAFSPRGNRIIFVAQECEGCPTAIMSMARDGGHRREVLPIGAGLGVDEVLISPDGSTIAYVSQPDEDVTPFQRALITVHRDGTHEKVIVPYRRDAGAHFGWAPDGRHLVYTAFSENPPGHRAHVVLIRPDGSHAFPITHAVADGVSDGGATWSPDGRWIVYRHQDDNIPAFWVFKQHPDGTGETQVGRLDSTPQGIVWAPHRR